MAQNGDRATPLRVLVVDDNVDAAESLGLLITRMGHDVRVAHTGAAALETARAQRPQVVLLDLSLPDLDGFEVARQLRREPDLAGVRLIALTGHDEPEDRARSREAGFDRHVRKPVDPALLGELLAPPR